MTLIKVLFVAEPVLLANMHKSSTLSLFDLNGTELKLVRVVKHVFALQRHVKRTAFKKVYNCIIVVSSLL